MSDKEQELQQKLAVLFREEAADHLKSLSDGLFSLEKKPPAQEEVEIIQSLFRSAHSLKGAARAINFFEIEGLCAAMEDVLAALKNHKLAPSSEIINILFEATDILEKFIINRDEGQLGETLTCTTDLIEKLEKLIESKEHVQGHVAEELPLKPSEAEPELQHVELPEKKHQKVKNPRTEDSIRISSVKIDRLLQHVEEMLMIKLTSQQKIHELENLNHLLEDWDNVCSHQDIENIFHTLSLALNRGSESEREDLIKRLGEYTGIFEHKKELFKTVVQKLNALEHLSEQDHRVITGLVDTVINDTKEILMQPFSVILSGLPKMARDLANSLNKKVSLEITGDEIEVDRRILEKLKDPIIHIVRNAVDHGIESPEERQKFNKDPIGSIQIHAKQTSGNAFTVCISDDGKGLDEDLIKEKAVQEGLIMEKNLESVTTEELHKLIFSPGFSTSPIVTDISGRGVGLDVLTENVEKLGGSVTINSGRGEGTRFIMSMPLTLATFRGIHIKVSEQEYILPTHHVSRVCRIPREEIKTVEGRQTISLGGALYSYVALSQLLKLPDQNGDNSILKPILLVKASDMTIALGVDAILNEQEVFVKGLGKQLKRVKNIAGTTIMEWGKVVPILDPFDLVKIATQDTLSPLQSPEEENREEERGKSILVVEDSITSRMLLKNILESAGYNVKSAVDGMEGYSMLQKSSFDLVLSDVEMPRMDGFALTKKIRNTEQLKTVPVILVTSRGSKEDREQGIKAGANAYLDKSNFMQKNLLDVIGQLL